MFEYIMHTYEISNPSIMHGVQRPRQKETATISMELYVFTYLLVDSATATIQGVMLYPMHYLIRFKKLQKLEHVVLASCMPFLFFEAFRCTDFEVVSYRIAIFHIKYMYYYTIFTIINFLYCKCISTK